MKVSELEPGTKILVPCIQCGNKRSITFKGVYEYKVAKQRPCIICSNEDSPRNANATRQLRKMHSISHEQMD